VGLTVFKNLSSLYFVFKYSAILVVISVFYVASIATRLSLFLYFLYVVFVSFRVRILYIAGILSLFLSKFYNSTSLQSFIQKLNLNTLRTGSFKLFKRPFPGFLTILTL